MAFEEESSIERLKRTLYSRNDAVVPKEKRTPVEAQTSDVPSNWGASPALNIPVEMGKRSNSFFNKFLLGSFAFFLCALGVAAFIFFGGLNTISSDNVAIDIVAPSSISSGEEFAASISIVNKNPTALEGVTLFIDYPEGAQALSDAGLSSDVISRDGIKLGTILKGGNKEQTIRATLFGEKDAVKTFNLRIEYKVSGSNATFSKEKKYDVLISSSPVLLDVSYPQEVNSGQDFTFSVHLSSNSAVAMKNTLIKVDYPYGFTYKNSNIKPLHDLSARTGTVIWNVGNLENGDKKILTITGILVGQDSEDRSFLISAGTQSSDPSKDFDAKLAESSATVGIRKSFFGLEVSSSEDNIAYLGQSASVAIRWQNTLLDQISNNHIEATLSGNAFDRSAVGVNGGGFYRSVDNTIVWDRSTTQNLASIAPGQEGQVSFSAAPISNPLILRTIKNPHIDVHVVMTGDRSGSNTSSVSSSQDLTLKVPTTLTLGARSYRNMGPFLNSGPVPPKADVESTYTVTWTLTNTTNDVKDVTVSAVLPTGILWKNEISPSNERISYNPDTRVVVWNVGNVSSGTGFTYSAKEASFKVGITPSITQIGTAPQLVGTSNVSAVDVYAEIPLSTNAQAVTIKYSDPNAGANSEIVTK